MLIIKEPRRQRRGTIVLLPGRGIPLSLMFRFAKNMDLADTMLIGISHLFPKRTWYPAPNGAHDQQAAVDGLPSSVAYVNSQIDKVCKAYHIDRHDMVLLGFSAGAVVANQVAIESKKPFLASISLSGAILEPDKIPPAKHGTTFVLQHNLFDACFSWHERYMPMRDALLRQGYHVVRLEKHYGEHNLYINDTLTIGIILSRMFGYPSATTRRLERKLSLRTQ